MGLLRKKLLHYWGVFRRLPDSDGLWHLRVHLQRGDASMPVAPRELFTPEGLKRQFELGGVSVVDVVFTDSGVDIRTEQMLSARDEASRILAVLRVNYPEHGHIRCKWSCL